MGECSADVDFLGVIGVDSPLELLTVEDLVIKLYQKKYHKEPSKTWVSRELDVVLWDFSSNTRYVEFFSVEMGHVLTCLGALRVVCA